MKLFIVIRDCRKNDKIRCHELIQEGILSNLPTAVLKSLKKKITHQMILLTAAWMFIFCRVPFELCILSVPFVLIIIYILMYLAYCIKILEYKQKPNSLRCWVAEAYEPYWFTQNPKDYAYTIITENELDVKNLNRILYQRKIVGTVSVDRHRSRHYSAWLHKLAVTSEYRRKGIGFALVLAAIRFCVKERYESIECATSECQQPARRLFLDTRFQLLQKYYKKLPFTWLEKYQMVLKLQPHYNSNDKKIIFISFRRIRQFIEYAIIILFIFLKFFL